MGAHASPPPSTPSLDRWRRVASTHRLEDLWDPGSRPRWSPRFALSLGFAIVLASLAAVLAGTAWLVRVGLPGRPPSPLYHVQALLTGIPVTLAFVSLNWFCLKLFKHNS